MSVISHTMSSMAFLGAVFLFMLPAPASAATFQAPEYSLTQVMNGHYGRAWISRNVNTTAEVHDTLIDAGGDVYTTGAIDGVAGSSDLFVARHDAQGNIVWQTTLDCPGLTGVQGCYDSGVALAQGVSGAIYVAADSTNGTDYDIVLSKLDAGTGATIGTGRYDRQTEDASVTVPTDDRAVALAVGDTDKIYVVGTTGTTADTNIVTMRFTSSVNLNWSTVYGDGNSYPDKPVGAGVDSAGDIIVAGTTTSGATDIYVAMKYNAVNGHDDSTWVTEKTFDTGTNDRATTMVVDNNGDLYVAGWSRQTGSGSGCTDTSGDMTVVKFSGQNGSEQWNRGCLDSGLYSSAGSRWDLPVAVTVDSSNNLYLLGKAGTIQTDFFTVKLDSVSGDIAWADVYDKNADDVPADIAVDTGGSVFITGATGTTMSHDLLVIRYDDTGARVDADEVVMDLGGDDRGRSLALGTDSDGDTVAMIGATSDRLYDGEQEAVIGSVALMRPDLTVDSVTSPRYWPYDVQINISAVIKNLLDAKNGKLAYADPSTVGIYLSTEASPTAATLNDPTKTYPIGTMSIGGLNAGASSAPVTLAYMVPNTIPINDYYVVAVADDLDVVSEQDELNNIVASSSIISVIDPPDLKADSVSGPASMPAGSDITVNYSISNLRTTASGNFDISFVLSRDNAVDSSDRVLTAVSGTTGLSVGSVGTASGTINDTATVTIPPDLAPGDYYIGLNVDPADDVLEELESNNTVTSLSTLTVEPIPNLVVSGVSGPPGSVIDTAISLDATVTAQAGSGSVVDSFTVDVYMSKGDAVLDGADTLIGTSAPIASLAAGASTTVTVNGTAPSAEGVYYLIADVDSGKTVLENNEDDNIGAGSETTSVGLPAGTGGSPDLIVSDVSTSASNALRGDTVTVTTRVENVLPEPATPASPIIVGIYLSPDAVITTSDIRVGERAITGIGGNSVDTGNTDVVLPTTRTEPVLWTNQVNVTVDPADSSLTSTTGFNTAGASSAQVIPYDGAVEVTATNDGTTRVIGLSASDIDTNWYSIDYMIYIRDTGAISFYENLTRVCGNWSYKDGDILRIERVGNVINYIQKVLQTDGSYTPITRCTSTKPSSGDLVVDTSFYKPDSTISKPLVSIVDLPPGTYYLGAIVDDTDSSGVVTAGTNRVAEVNENNNSGLQTDSSGAGKTFDVGVLQGSAASSAGGGGLGAELLALLLLCLTRLVRPQSTALPAHDPS